MTNYGIAIANRIRNGRTVGTDYVVVGRPPLATHIVARFSTREEAQAFIAEQTAYADLKAVIGAMRGRSDSLTCRTLNALEATIARTIR